VFAASDFLTVKVWTGRGLVTHYLLFVISLADRVVEVVGVSAWPDEAWMLQMGRRLTDSENGALCGKRYMIIDRDAKYTQQFRRLVGESGTEVIQLPPMSPNLNAYAERFVRSIKDECLDRMIFIGQASLRRAICEYAAHYHAERNHQGLENRLIRPEPMRAANDDVVHRRPRLGGSRVETAHYCAIPPSEPCVIVSHHTAQASAKAPCGTRFNNYVSRRCDASCLDLSSLVSPLMLCR